MVRGGRTIADVATSLGVTEQSLRNWVKQTSSSVANATTG
ncbi:MAG: transposase [Solirubrobacteraceae bacterium]